MQPVDDIALLRQFAENHSDEAFAGLVERYINLVYSVALRQVGSPPDAEEITQAVFIILAKKAGQLRHDKAISSWLFQTTRLTANNFVRSEMRRHRREQEAFMQSVPSEFGEDAWPRIAPLLDDAVGALNEKERRAIILRFYEGRNLRDVGTALGVSEDASEKRISRALEKLRKFFFKRGVHSATATIAGAISANSIHTAPIGLAKTISAVALAKGTVASASTLTLAKGALKLMAWTKTQAAVVAGIVVLLAVAPAPVIIKAYENHRTYSWELPPFPQTSDEKLWKTAPQVRIIPSKYHHFMYGFGEDGISYVTADKGASIQTNYGSWQSIGIGCTLDSIVQSAYNAPRWQILYLTPLPKKPLYDYISNLHNLPKGTAKPLQELIEKKFGIIATWEPRETDVMVVKLASPDPRAFKPSGSLMRSMGVTNISAVEYALGATKYQQQQNGGIESETYFNYSVDQLIRNLSLQDTFNLPIINETGLTNRYDCTINFPQWNPGWGNVHNPWQKAWKDALAKQLGLELVPAKRTVEMLVVEKDR